MQKITPFLWFENQAEQAAEYYVSIFRNSRIKEVSRFGESGSGQAGSVMSVSFELEGEPFMALNGSQRHKFTPALSLFVSCETQAEVDALWERLGNGGEELACGWVTDKFGVTWQIIPRGLGELMKSPKAVSAMLGMKKIDLEQMRKAARS